MSLKLLSIISLILVLSACGSRQKTDDISDVQVITKWRTFDCGASPDIDFVDFDPPIFQVTDGNFCLASDEYAKLGQNMTTLIKVTKQMMLKLDYYEQCIDSAQEIGDGHGED